MVPMVDQLEFHPGYIQKAAVDFCQKHGILVEAWSPIGRGRVLEEPLLLELARSYGKTPAQICLRFALQCNVLPLPKSSSEERMRENMKVFDFTISQEDIYRIMTLPQVGWSGSIRTVSRSASETVPKGRKLQIFVKLPLDYSAVSCKNKTKG